MNESMTFKGYWWLPSNPDNKIAGVLTCKPNESIIIELIGAFNSNECNPIDLLLERSNEKIIYGLDSEAKIITLIDCHISMKYNFSSFPVAKYSANYMVYGKHVVGIDEICDYQATVKFPELSYWCLPNALKIQYEQKSGLNIQAILFDKLDEDTETLAFTLLENGTQLSIKQGYQFSTGNMGLEPNLSQFTYLKLSKQDGLSIKDILWLARRFESFLSIATLRSVHYYDITLMDEDICQVLSNGQKHYVPIKVYDSFGVVEDTSKLDIGRFLFSFHDIKDDYEAILRNWMSTSDNMMPMKNHLAESIIYKKAFSSVDFLVVVQSLEGFWWRQRDDEYSKRNKHSNRTKLETILLELLKEYLDISIVSSMNLNVRAVVDSRNYYTHYVDKSKKPATLEGRELLFLTKKIRVLLLCCVLSFVGFSHEKLNEILENCHNESLIYWE